MSPIYGRAFGKDRAVMSAPYLHGNQITMISAISLDKIEASMYGQWAANTEIFGFFIEHYLAPVLTPKHTVVMDNVPFHKSTVIQNAIRETGANILFLPPYSPEFNPIEEMWSKLKCLLRKLQARTMITFKSAIKKAYDSISQSDLLGWFKHAGY